jgi:hypothetical protein
LDTVESENAAICAFPQALVVGTSTLDCGPQLVDEFGISDGDFEIWTLLVALEAVKVLSEKHLYRIDGRLMLSEVGLEICFVGLAIALLERHGRSYVEVVHEVGDVQQDRVAGLERNGMVRRSQ